MLVNWLDFEDSLFETHSGIDFQRVYYLKFNNLMWNLYLKKRNNRVKYYVPR